jgi:hypothetical protein
MTHRETRWPSRSAFAKRITRIVVDRHLGGGFG